MMYAVAAAVLSSSMIHMATGFVLDGVDPHNVGVTVQTSCGDVRGLFKDNAFSFRGIPYALPPTGIRRWHAPVPLNKTSGTCWDGVYDATSFQSQCFQHGTFGSEDCLYLNVWTPTFNKSANLPVMVWIHGGSLTILNGNSQYYCPTEELAHDTGVVYVSMNYRLNAFGFMALDILSRNSKTNTSGNYGFMDQILALQWVQDNIRNFGGDPGQVTLFGQSSGGTSILAHLASPLSKGLFHKAWLMSASPRLDTTTQQASADNLQFLKNTRCENISCLQQLSASAIIYAIPWVKYPSWRQAIFGDLPQKGQFVGALAVVDGHVVPESPQDSWMNGHANDVPLLIGTMAQELDAPELPSSTTWLDYKTKVSGKLESFGESIAKMAIKMYPSGNETPAFQYSSMGGDIRVSCPTDLLALYASLNTKSPVYRYVSTARPSQTYTETHSSYAFHGLDSYAFFGSVRKWFSQSNPNDEKYEANIRREVLSFINTGAPYTQNWGTFPNVTAILSYETSIQNAYHAQECNFWMANGFQEYSWIN